jgi:hypothetical protein
MCNFGRKEGLFPTNRTEAHCRDKNLSFICRTQSIPQCRSTLANDIQTKSPEVCFAEEACVVPAVTMEMPHSGQTNRFPGSDAH